MSIGRYLLSFVVMVVCACGPEAPSKVNSPTIFKSEKVIEQVGAYYVVMAPERKNKRGSAKKWTKNLEALNPKEFNFTQIPNDFVGEHSFLNVKSTLIKQKWPYAYNHGLLVPNIQEKIPQRLSLKQLRVVEEFVSMQKTRRAGYNSLMSGASVNHLHFHIFHTDKQMIALPIELAKMKPSKKTGVLINTSYPIDFILSSDVNKVWKIIDHFQQNDHPFSLIIAPQGFYIVPKKANVTPWRQGNKWSFSEVAGMIPLFENDVPGWLNEGVIESHFKELNYGHDEVELLVEKILLP